jgi:hypothetical protein
MTVSESPSIVKFLSCKEIANAAAKRAASASPKFAS